MFGAGRFGERRSLHQTNALLLRGESRVELVEQSQSLLRGAAGRHGAEARIGVELGNADGGELLASLFTLILRYLASWRRRACLSSGSRMVSVLMVSDGFQESGGGEDLQAAFSARGGHNREVLRRCLSGLVRAVVGV